MLRSQAELVREEFEGRWCAYGYDEFAKRDKTNLGIFWLKDERLSESENLLSPDLIAQEIMDDLETALEQIREIVTNLKEKTSPGRDHGDVRTCSKI